MVLSLPSLPLSSVPGSVISFHMTPSHIRSISLHFLTLSYGGGCFLGALIIQLVYLLSGGKGFTNRCIIVTIETEEEHTFMLEWLKGVCLHYGDSVLWPLIALFSCPTTGNFYPNTLHEGNLEHFFFFLSMLMTINTLVFWWISYRYSMRTSHVST